MTLSASLQEEATETRREAVDFSEGAQQESELEPGVLIPKPNPLLLHAPGASWRVVLRSDSSLFIQWPKGVGSASGSHHELELVSLWALLQAKENLPYSFQLAIH